MSKYHLTVEEKERRIKEKYPLWDFEIISCNDGTDNIVLRCAKCGRKIVRKSHLGWLSVVKYPCVCTGDSNTTLSKRYKDELQTFFENSKDFLFIQWKNCKESRTKKPSVELKCLHCDGIFEQRITIFYKKRACPYCTPQGMPNTNVIAKRLKEKGYSLIGEYKNSATKCLIRHDKCGFIWKIPLQRNRELDGSCPMCNRTISKGEQRIINYCNSHGISYEKEKKFEWQTHPLFRYDFFLPAYDLIIEFNGRQHYEETNIFTCSLDENKEHDKIKCDEALQNGYYYLIIPYTKIKKINEILDKWFNDYPKGVNNLTVIERNISAKSEKNIV